MTPTCAVGFVLVYLASNLAIGLFSEVTEEESIQVKEVLKHLSYAECDMIVVSWSAFYGKVLVTSKSKLTTVETIYRVSFVPKEIYPISDPTL